MRRKPARSRDTLLGALEAFRSLHYDITLSEVLTFLQVARDGPTTFRSLAESLELSYETALRSAGTYAPADWPSAQKPALGLFDFRIGGANNRLVTVELNLAGREVASQLDARILAGVTIAPEPTAELDPIPAAAA
jgi:hypothetical protein